MRLNGARGIIEFLTVLLFQFKYCAIERTAEWKTSLIKYDFNSSIVRLNGTEVTRWEETSQ